MAVDGKHLFYVEWYRYVNNGTHTFTVVETSVEYDISRGLIVNNGGSLRFKLFDGRLLITFEICRLNIFGGRLS